MSIRDIQLPNISEMRVSIDVARYLLSKQLPDTSYVMRCRLEILKALQYGCQELAVLRDYTVECYGNDVYKNVDYLSDTCPDVQMLIHLFNAAHPDCDFARIQVANQEYSKAYELLDFYLELLDSFMGVLEAESLNKGD